MSETAIRIPKLSEATVDEKLALIDELWESVRRSAHIKMRDDHLAELAVRVSAVREDPSVALSAAEARAQLKR